MKELKDRCNSEKKGCHQNEHECRRNDIVIQKCVDKSCAKKGDILRYRNEIKYCGNGIAKGLIFRDCLCDGLKFMECSVRINGDRKIKYEPEKGFKLPTMVRGTVTIVEFDAEVK